MPLPTLNHWTETASGLHRGALLLGALQRLTQPPQPAYLELGLQLIPNGLVGGVLPAGGRVALDFPTASLVYTPAGSEADNARRVFPLSGAAQAQVFADLFTTLAERELAQTLPPGDGLFERLSAGVAARGRRYRPLKPETLIDAEPIAIDLPAAAGYLAALQAVFTGIARFRARLGGMMTPLVVWPEHFDLSTLWFSGPELDENRPHLNFGFAPYSEGLPDPYLYAYAYPYPDRYSPPTLPAGARWNTQPWTGMVLPYPILAAQPDPAAYVESSCGIINTGLLGLIS